MSRRADKYYVILYIIMVLMLSACADGSDTVPVKEEQPVVRQVDLDSLQPESLQLSGLESSQSESPQLSELESAQSDSLQPEQELAQIETATVAFDGMAPDIARILQRGYLLVAMPAADTPIFHEADGSGGVSGIDADLARGIAESLGVEVVFDRTSETFLDLTDKLKRGEVDLVISTYSMTTERTMYVDFSDPYLETYLSVLVGKQALVSNHIEDNPLEYMKMNEVTIGAVSGTAHYDMVKTLFPRAQVVGLTDYQEGYDKVVAGELFAFLSGELEFLSAFEKDPVIGLYASVFSFSDLRDQFCIGVSRDTPQLLDYVNTYLRTANRLTYVQVAQMYRERYGND